MTAAPLEDQRSLMEWLVSRCGSQAELARRAELGVETISDYVRGVNEPKLSNVLKMLRAAEVRIEGAPERRDQTEETLALVRQMAERLGIHEVPPPGGSTAV